MGMLISGEIKPTTAIPKPLATAMHVAAAGRIFFLFILAGFLLLMKVQAHRVEC
jgi:hypothetical protein